MNIPEGFVLVPVEPTEEMLEVLHSSVLIQVDAFERTADIINDRKWWSSVVAAAPPVELPAYDEAKELAACRAHWEKNPNCLFSDMWLGWKACAQSRDGSVGDE